MRKAEGDSYGPWWEARGPHAPMPGAAQPPAAAAFSKASPMGLQPPGWLLARVGLRAQAALARMLQAPPAPGGARGLRAAVVTKAEPLVSAGAPAAAPGGEAPPPADSLVVTLSPVPADGAPAPPANVSSAWGENPMHAVRGAARRGARSCGPRAELACGWRLSRASRVAGHPPRLTRRC